MNSLGDLLATHSFVENCESIFRIFSALRLVSDVKCTLTAVLQIKGSLHQINLHG